MHINNSPQCFPHPKLSINTNPPQLKFCNLACPQSFDCERGWRSDRELKPRIQCTEKEYCYKEIEPNGPEYPSNEWQQATQLYEKHQQQFCCDNESFFVKRKNTVVGMCRLSDLACVCMKICSCSETTRTHSISPGQLQRVYSCDIHTLQPHT